MKYRKRHARILAVMLSAVMLFSATGSFLTSATTVEIGGFVEETEIMDSGSLGDDFAETEEELFIFRNELPPEATPSKAELPETAIPKATPSKATPSETIPVETALPKATPSKATPPQAMPKMAAYAENTVAVIEDVQGNVKQFTSLRDAINTVSENSSGTIKIVKDIDENRPIYIAENRDITLLSDGAHSITFGFNEDKACFGVPENSILTIGDADDTENVLTITSSMSCKTLFDIYGGGKLILNSGTLTVGDGVNLSQGIVKLWRASFEMHGGTILGNAGNILGVRVEVNSHVIMDAGTIEECSYGAVRLAEYAEFTMDKTAIIQNCSWTWGGGIQVNNNSVFTMNNGTIHNCTAEDGGAFMVQGSGSKVVLNGGMIQNCTAAKNGGAFYLQKDAILEMNGGTISQCSAQKGSGVYIGQTATFTMNDGKIEDCSSANGQYVFAANGAIFNKTGGTIADVAAKIGDVEYYLLEEAIGAIPENGSGTIEIVKDIEVTKPIYIENGRNITLLSDGAHSITFKDNERECFGLSKKSILTIGDVDDTENVLTITSSTGCRTLFEIWSDDIQRGTKLILNSGTLTIGDGVELSSGIVKLWRASFEMHGGTIQGNAENEGNTLGVRAEDHSHVIMDAGTIEECSSGAVRLYKNTEFVMDKTAIIQNCSGTQGGGIQVDDNSVFTMNNGTIQNCIAAQNGGGIYLNGENAAFVMTGGTIRENKAVEGDGGGVYVTGKASFTLSGGSIEGNNAGEKADINQWKGGRGGGVAIREGAFFGMDGGTVRGNTAKIQGGGIYLMGVDNRELTYQITAGEISGNVLTDPYGYGGGVYVDKNVTLNLRNVVITENSATALGGGIWSCRTGDIKMYITDGGAVYDNIAAARTGNGTANAAGDDLASTVTFPATGFLLLSHHMLGGGTNRYYEDGGITGLVGGDYGLGYGLGAPDGTTPRYDGANAKIVTDTEITSSIALKNVASGDAKAAAEKKAQLIISGNLASRGGGIGTNGNLNIGIDDPSDKTGSLTVKKETAGSGINAGDTFTIRITLAGHSADTVSGEYGEMTFKDGVAVVNLKAGESMTATGLPAGMGYKVEETDAEDYIVSYDNQEGTIVKDAVATVTVRNEKKDKPDSTPKTGNLTVSKTVSGSGASRQKDFRFTVTLSDPGIQGVYGDMNFVNGMASFTLKHGESKTARDLPEGTGFHVEEEDRSGYTISVNQSSGYVTEGTILAGETALAAFHNYKGGGGDDDDDDDEPSSTSVVLKAGKTLNGAWPNDRFFTFYLKDRNGNVIQEKRNNSRGEIVFDRLYFSSGGQWIYYITEAAGQEDITWDYSVYKVKVDVTGNHGNYYTAVTYEKDGQPVNGQPVFANFTKTPGDPNDPDDPGDPNDPGNPGNPGNPGGPGRSGDPGNPGRPGGGRPLDPVPQTGDNTHTELWLWLTCISMIGLCLMRIFRKKGHMVFLVLAFLSGALLLKGEWTQNQERKAFEEIRNFVFGAGGQAGSGIDISVAEPAETAEPEELEVKSRLAALYERNPDFAGWLKIEGTRIDYPVMLTPKDPEYYIRRDFEGKPSSSGVPFIGEGCEPGNSNLLIYGHNMKNGEMFHDLTKYVDQAYYEEHPVLRFDTSEEEGEYQIIAAFEEEVHYQDETGVFRYYSYGGELSEEQFSEYVKAVKEHSFYDTGVSASYGDKLITLSTCIYNRENGRLVVVARK